MSVFPKGSEWRKWDLHFHTPSSFDYHDKSVTNQQIVDLLAKENISVSVVSDHNTIDVDRIKELQRLGATKGITFFPGIELRGDKRGREPINLIGIFSNTCDLEYVANELLTHSGINKQRISDKKKEEEIYVDTFKVCDLIHDLGGIVTVHAGNKSNSIEQCFPNALPVNIAEKLDLIEKIDVFEIATVNDIANYRTKVFPNIKKSLPLVKTSDNHDVKDTLFPDDLFCWIKADPTFDGLKQIIYEPEDRVYVGQLPPVIERVNANKTKYMTSLIVTQVEGYNQAQGEWFKDVKIDLNSELIAIIGNKGSCKSAVSDIIGIMGNAHNAVPQTNLSFLNKTKFRKRGYAENFQAELLWRDGRGAGDHASLGTDIDLNEPQRVNYLPQNYFENLTNDLSGEGFSSTLKSVTFLHLPEEQRLGFRAFDELESFKSKNIEAELADLHIELHDISAEIIKLEAKQHPDYRQQIENAILEKNKELAEHKKLKPKEVQDPAKNANDEVDEAKKKQYEQLEKFNTRLDKIRELLLSNRSQLNSLTREKAELTSLSDALGRLRGQVDTFKREHETEFEKYGLVISDVIKLSLDQTTLNTKIKEKSTSIGQITMLLRSKEQIDSDTTLNTPELIQAAYKASLNVERTNIQDQVQAIKSLLSKPEKDFQEYKEKLAKWELRFNEIKGNSTRLNTLDFYKAEKHYLENSLGAELLNKRSERHKKTLEVFRKKKEIIELYKVLKESIDREIAKDKEFAQKFKMAIDVNFQLDVDFAKSFLGYIKKNKRGTYLGATEKEVNELFAERDLLDENTLAELLTEIISSLEEDRRNDEDLQRREISDQIEKIQEFYDFVFSLNYLQPIYELKLDGKILQELSPGEKGALLLVFYLMIDKEDIPLIIDQPEDNLDNKSVFQVLTHFIKSAKKRRQIIIVTHNPNLAVGADAEQIIYVALDKKSGKNIFSYETGSIEDANINARIVEILEGTMPAFDKRKLRYLIEPTA